MSSHYTYLIDSLAPLVFRSGRPFGSQASAADVTFPLPSSAAGLVRAIGISQDKLNFDEVTEKIINDPAYQKILSQSVRGPFLIRYDDSHQYELLLPKPASAIYLEDKTTGELKLLRLAPQALDADCGSDLPENLLPVQLSADIKGKPKSGATYWRIDHLIAWLNGEDLDYKVVNEAGLVSLPIDIRTHVAIDSETYAAQDGKLFQTASFDLGYKKDEVSGGWTSKKLGFMLESQLQLDDDFATFGGERRLSKFTSIDMQLPLGANQTLLDQINDSNGFSLCFITPVIFAQGYLPAWIDPESFEGLIPSTQIKVKLKSVAVDRWIPVSGWDSLVWKPKAMRKAVTAGSIYWFELIDKLDMQALQTLTDSALSDHVQDQRDGFGVGVVSAWRVTK